MVGDMIHIRIRQDLRNGGVTILSTHATFEGAQDLLNREADYFEGVGYIVERNKDQSFIVKAVDRPLWYYFISSRTIDK